MSGSSEHRTSLSEPMDTADRRANDEGERSDTLPVAFDTEQLSTERTLLRRLTEHDAAALHDITGSRRAMRYWYPGPDPDVAATARRIAEIESHWRDFGFGDWAVIERNGDALIGFAGLHHISDMAEVNIGYVLEPSHWRCGLGTEVCQEILDYGLGRLALPEVVAVIDPRNRASTGLASKCGLWLRERRTWQGQPRVVYSLTRARWVPKGSSD